jgi:hypothetical protein
MRFLLLILLLVVLVACNKQVDYIGTSSPSANPYLVQVDTFQAQAIVYRPDSIRTSAYNSMYTGIQKDPVLGVMKMTPFFRLTLPSVTPQIDNASYYDSLVLVIRLNKTYYGDTNSLFKLNADRLSDDMTNSNGDIFYSNQSFAVYPGSLGAVSKLVRPASGDSLVIKLDNVLGKQLFDMFKNKTIDVTDSAQFRTFLKGIRLTADAASNVIYSVPVNDSAVRMQLLYHEDVGRPVAKQINFGLRTSTYFFTNISVDRSSTPLAALNNQTEIAAPGLLVTDEMTQLRTRLLFPTVAGVQKLGSYVKILNASLVVKPVPSRYSSLSLYQLPPAINIHTYDLAGVVSTSLFEPGTTNAETGNLVVDNEFGTGTQYSFNVTDYVNSQLTASTYTSQQLVFTLPAVQTKLATLVANITPGQQYTTKLVLSLLVYNEKQ